MNTLNTGTFYLLSNVQKKPAKIVAKMWATISRMSSKWSLSAQRQIESMQLSRYACYLIVQNADPAKEVVALGQTYFAVQTRLQEIQQMSAYNNLGSDNEKQLFLRNELRRHNAQLADAAKDAGVIDILEHMGSTELAANLFRATQTEDKLRRENIKGKDKANLTHFEVGQKVRETIHELGGTMPESLPIEENIGKLERKEKKKLNSPGN